MVSLLLFLIAVVAFGVGHTLLLRSAWRMRKNALVPPAGVPRSNAQADLGWTLFTAVASFALLWFVFFAL